MALLTLFCVYSKLNYWQNKIVNYIKMSSILNFIKKLQSEGKSKSSLRGYKSDVKQFMKWKENNNYELTHSLYSIYKTYLNRNYLKSTSNRKASAVSQFLDYTLGKEEKSSGSEIKLFKRNTMFLAGYTILLVLVIAIAYSQITRPSFESKADIPRNEKYSTDVSDSFVKRDGINIVVSAPEKAMEPNSRFVDIQKSSSVNNLSESSGRKVIKANETETTIYSNAVNEDSVIVVSANSAIEGNIYVSNQGEGYFVVSISKTNDDDVLISWISKNIDNSISIY